MFTNPLDVRLSGPSETRAQKTSKTFETSGTSTPEHHFAAGYAACFGGAFDMIALLHKQDVSKAIIACTATIGPRDGGGFRIAVKMCVSDETLPTADLDAIVQVAHKHICPYSHSTRSPVDVTFDVKGAG